MTHEYNKINEFDLASYDPTQAVENFKDKLMDPAATDPAAMIRAELSTLHDDAVWPFIDPIINHTQPYIYGIDSMNLPPLEPQDEREERFVEAGRFIDTILRVYPWALPLDQGMVAERIRESCNNYSYYTHLGRLTDNTPYYFTVSSDDVMEGWKSVQSVFYKQEVNSDVDPSQIGRQWINLRSILGEGIEGTIKFQDNSVTDSEYHNDSLSDMRIASWMYYEQTHKVSGPLQSAGVIDAATALWDYALSPEEKTDILKLKDKFVAHHNLLVEFGDNATSYKDTRFRAALDDYAHRFANGNIANVSIGTSLDSYLDKIFRVIAIDPSLQRQPLAQYSKEREGYVGKYPRLDAYITDVSLALLMSTAID